MRDTLEKLRRGEISVEEAEASIRDAASIDIGGLANFDTHRERRTGVPEVILAEGKQPEHLLPIIEAVVHKKGKAIITRVARESAESIKAFANEHSYECIHNEKARAVVVKKANDAKVGLERNEDHSRLGKVAVITAGTSDIPVAEEAKLIAEELGCKVFSEYDVGVAGIHRTFAALAKLKKEGVHVYIVAAGREGALPTIIAGMVEGPVIGVPVSVGYGIAPKGEAALHAMLQSCSPLVVVNIDAGFVAGAVAAQIANRIAKGY